MPEIIQKAIAKHELEEYNELDILELIADEIDIFNERELWKKDKDIKYKIQPAEMRIVHVEYDI